MTRSLQVQSASPASSPAPCSSASSASHSPTRRSSTSPTTRRASSTKISTRPSPPTGRPKTGETVDHRAVAWRLGQAGARRHRRPRRRRGDAGARRATSTRSPTKPEDHRRLAHAPAEQLARPTPRRSSSSSARAIPKGIKDWGDLIKDGVEVITPNPKTSGGARWNYLAAWAWANEQFGGDEAKIKEFVGKLYRACAGARHRRARLDHHLRPARHRRRAARLGERGLPRARRVRRRQVRDRRARRTSILAEPPVAVVDGNVDAKGTRKVAEAYLDYLYSAEGQKLAAKHYYRPSKPELVPADELRSVPEMKLVIDRRSDLRRLGEGAAVPLRRRRRLRPDLQAGPVSAGCHERLTMRRRTARGGGSGSRASSRASGWRSASRLPT